MTQSRLGDLATQWRRSGLGRRAQRHLAESELGPDAAPLRPLLVALRSVNASYRRRAAPVPHGRV